MLEGARVWSAVNASAGLATSQGYCNTAAIRCRGEGVYILFLFRLGVSRRVGEDQVDDSPSWRHCATSDGPASRARAPVGVAWLQPAVSKLLWTTTTWDYEAIASLLDV
eukprot:2952168-Prymnesium_polylepis.1